MIVQPWHAADSTWLQRVCCRRLHRSCRACHAQDLTFGRQAVQWCPMLHALAFMCAPNHRTASTCLPGWLYKTYVPTSTEHQDGTTARCNKPIARFSPPCTQRYSGSWQRQDARMYTPARHSVRLVLSRRVAPCRAAPCAGPSGQVRSSEGPGAASVDALAQQLAGHLAPEVWHVALRAKGRGGRGRYSMGQRPHGAGAWGEVSSD